MSQFSEITSMNDYNTRMAKSILDKAFFVDKVECDAIVDFGCANGDLLSFIAPMVGKGVALIGYDLDEEMVRLADEKLGPELNEHSVFSNWDRLLEYLERANFKNVCLVLSSVIHEIYHYSAPKEIDEFWNSVSSANFKNIVIRDMIPSKTIERVSDTNSVAAIYKKDDASKLLQDFEKHHGSINSNKNLIHFLMKYRYKEPNWDREVKENYFPISYEELLSLIPDGYEIIYNNHYVLPYVYRNVYNDFGVKIKDNTHLQIIIEKS